MAAAATDLLMEVGLPGSATTLSAPGYTIGGTSITVASTTNWATDTGVCFAIDLAEVDDQGNQVRIDGTYCEFVGVVASGTSVTNVSKVFGPAQDYPAGALTRVYTPVSSERENRIVEWGTAEHNQDGTHSAVTADSILIADGGTLEVDTVNEATSANGVTIDGMNVKDGYVVGSATSGIKNESLGTGATDLGSAWQSWTPTYTNLTVGSGTVVAKYKQVGKTVFADYLFTYGSGSSVGTDPTITLPVTAAARYTSEYNLGIATIKDTGTALWPGVVTVASTTTVKIQIPNAQGDVRLTPPTSTKPMTWATGDAIALVFTYEAA